MLHRLRRRLLLLLAAVVMLIASLFVVTPPAFATQFATTCQHWGNGDRYICINTEYKNSGGPTGIIVYSVEIRIHWPQGAPIANYWNAPTAFDCDAIRIWNEPNDVIKWRQDGNQCDIARADQADAWIMPGGDLNMPDTAEAVVSLAGYPKLAGVPDPGRVVITQHLFS